MKQHELFGPLAVLLHFSLVWIKKSLCLNTGEFLTARSDLSDICCPSSVYSAHVFISNQNLKDNFRILQPGLYFHIFFIL